MSDDWTPSTEQVRAHYVFDQSDKWDPERGEAFDRWMAAHDAKVRAEAWDEALDHVWELNDPAYTFITDTDSIHPILTRTDVEQARHENPYRRTE